MTHHSLYLFDGIFFSKIWREQSKRAVACGAATVDQRGGDGRTPLHVAAQWGHHKVVHPGAWCSSSRWGFFFAMLHFRKLLRKLWRIIRWFTGVRCPPQLIRSYFWVCSWGHLVFLTKSDPKSIIMFSVYKKFPVGLFLIVFLPQCSSSFLTFVQIFQTKKWNLPNETNAVERKCRR